MRARGLRSTLLLAETRYTISTSVAVGMQLSRNASFQCSCRASFQRRWKSVQTRALLPE